MKNNKEIKIKNLIALCYIIDEFDSFNKKIKELYMNTNGKYSLCIDIGKLAKNEYVFGKRSIKEFYRENIDIINTIQKHTNIQDFIYENYNSSGELHYNVMYYHTYLKNNRDEINKILNLLYKLEKLKFSELIFNPDIDFSKNDYEIDSNFGNNFNIYYLENMNVIPNYDKNTIKYRTIESNYEIKLKPYLNREVSIYNREIKLNSLTFDSDKLPKVISKENTFDEILSLKKEHDEDLVINAVKLSVGVYDLKNQFDITEQIIKKIDNISDKKELVKLLSTINNSMNGLLRLCNEYDRQIEESSDSITKELLEKEKQIYLRKRYYNNID